MTLTAAQIARQAAEADEAPRRQREADRKAARLREQERLRAEAAKRGQYAFDRSPVAEWFPGVEWTFIEESDNGDHCYDTYVWQTGDGYDRLKLGITGASVSFLTHPDNGKWRGPVVNSAADVGREIARERERSRWPERENWAD